MFEVPISLFFNIERFVRLAAKRNSAKYCIVLQCSRAERTVSFVFEWYALSQLVLGNHKTIFIYKHNIQIYQSCQRHSWLLQAKVLSAPPIQLMYTPSFGALSDWTKKRKRRKRKRWKRRKRTWWNHKRPPSGRGLLIISSTFFSHILYVNFEENNDKDYYCNPERWSLQ